jgi:hypothetical protein
VGFHLRPNKNVEIVFSVAGTGIDPLLAELSPLSIFPANGRCSSNNGHHCSSMKVVLPQFSSANHQIIVQCVGF